MRQSNHSYEKDFYKWSLIQADLLRRGELSKIDIDNLAEEIESLARSDKRKLQNLLVVLLQHLLKNTYTPQNKGNSKSWDATIFNSRKGISKLLEDSPSLKPILKEMLEESYTEARELALIESNHVFTEEEIFPVECPWALKKILGE